MVKHLVVALTIITICLTWSGAHAMGLEAALGGWQQNPSGSFAYKANNINDVLDVENDLNYDTQTRVHGRLKVDMPLFLPNIYVIAAPTEFDADGQKNVQFKFGDQVFDGNVPFYSKLTFNQYDVGLYYGLPFIEKLTLKKFNVDVGLNVRIIDLKAQVRQADTGIDETHSATLPIPQVYVAAQLTPVEWLAIEAEGRGISINGNSLYSFIGRVRLKIFGPAFVAAGYRHDNISVDEDDAVLDFTIQGPFAEVGLKF